MSKDKVNLTLPEVQLVAEVDCDEVECSIEILDHTFRSFNLFDVQNRKFFVTFDAQVKISFYLGRREEDGMIRRIQINKEHLIEKKPIIDRFAIISYLAVSQDDDGKLSLFDLDKKSFEKSSLFADQEMLKKKIIRRQQAELDSQFDRFQIEDFYRKRVFKKFAISESKEMKEYLQSYQNMLIPVLAYVIDNSGEKIFYNHYLSMRRDASYVKHDNLLETIDFI